MGVRKDPFLTPPENRGAVELGGTVRDRGAKQDSCSNETGGGSRAVESPWRQAKGLGAQLRVCRENAGLNLRKAADAVDWDKSTLSRLETGKRNMTGSGPHEGQFGSFVFGISGGTSGGRAEGDFHGAGRGEGPLQRQVEPW
jgi:hypothetical protein